MGGIQQRSKNNHSTIRVFQKEQFYISKTRIPSLPYDPLRVGLWESEADETQAQTVMNGVTKDNPGHDDAQSARPV
jgi:hypothetical protein